MTLIGTKPQYAVSIKNGDTTVYNKAKTEFAKNVPASGNFDIGIDMTYVKWAAITDNTALTIEITIYDSTGNTEQEGKTFTANKTANGNIYSWRDLQNMSAKLDATYTLQNDIVFPTAGEEAFASTGFVPIGSSANKFSGFLEGNNKTITGLYIKNNALNDAGLFGYIQKTDKTDIAVQNLTLHNTSIEAYQYIGSLAGRMSNAKVTTTASTVDSDKQTSHIIQGSSSNVGGLIGSIDNSTLQGYTMGNVNGVRQVGGLTGRAGTYSSVQGYTTGNISADSVAGGLVGSANGSMVQGYTTGNISAPSNTGGLVGNSGSNSTIQGYALGYVIGNLSYTSNGVGNNRNNSGARLSAT